MRHTEALIEANPFLNADPYACALLERVGGLERFISSYSQRTFSPERRAISAIREGADAIAKGVAFLSSSGADEDTQKAWADKASAKWLAMEAAGARTMNWMITGPARFPVERNRKALDTEMKRVDEYLQVVNGVEEWWHRQQRKVERQALSEEAQGQNFEEVEAHGLRLIKNTTLDRVQLIFPGKPDDEMRVDLKKSAFRWSPREGAWQRKLTRNGLWAAQGIQAAWIEQHVAEGC